MHIINKNIGYISNGTDPNTLNIIPTNDLGKCLTQDGTQEWNYDVSLPAGTKWVLKSNSLTQETWFLSSTSSAILMSHSVAKIFEFNTSSTLGPNKLELIPGPPLVGVRALQTLTGIVNGFVNINSPVAGDIFVKIKANASGSFGIVRETLVANAYRVIPISIPFVMFSSDIIRLELTLGGSTPAGSHTVQFGECKLSFSVLS